MMHNCRIITLLFFFLAMIPSAFSQIRILPREKVESVSNPKLSLDSANLSFETKRIAADKMNEDDPPKTFIFRFENVGRERIVINRLVSTCSCASATVSRNMVGPGEKAEIAVRYNPKGHPGKFERRIFVYTGDEDAPAAVLKLAVDVENGADLSGMWPVQMGNIRLRRSEVTFKKGVKAVEKLRFINLSGRELEVKCEEAFLPACLSFRTEPDVVAAGETGEIVITYDPSAETVRESNKVMLKGLGVPPSQSCINVLIQSEENE